MILCPVLNLQLAWNQPDDMVRQLAERCYRPLLGILKTARKSRVTLAIDGALLDRLETCGAGDIIESTAKLVESGQVELMGCANDNAMLKGLPADEIARRVDEHADVLRRHFGELFRPAGFFPPELAYDDGVGGFAADRGYRWVLVDEVAAGEGGLESPQLCHHEIEATGGLLAFFRHRGVSTGMIYRGFETLSDLLSALGATPETRGYVVTANTAEIFGYHHAGYESLLASILGDAGVRTLTLSGVLAELELPTRTVPLRSSTWGTWETLQY